MIALFIYGSREDCLIHYISGETHIDGTIYRWDNKPHESHMLFINSLIDQIDIIFLIILCPYHRD